MYYVTRALEGIRSETTNRVPTPKMVLGGLDANQQMIETLEPRTGALSSLVVVRVVNVIIIANIVATNDTLRPKLLHLPRPLDREWLLGKVLSPLLRAIWAIVFSEISLKVASAAPNYLDQLHT